VKSGKNQKPKKNYNSSSDYIAFLVGNSQVALYSPNGKCQHILSSLNPAPIGVPYLTMALLDKQILSCGGGNSKSQCFLYDVATDTWTFYSTSNAVHNLRRGVAHQGKIYIMDDSHPEVFDPLNKTWLFKKAPPTSVEGIRYYSFLSHLYYLHEPRYGTIFYMHH
jgi:hypothetical protein